MKKLFVLLCLCMSIHAFGAIVVFENTGSQCPYIKIEGEIENGDSRKIKNLIEQMKIKHGQSCGDGNKTVRINSNGGGVDEALLIGRDIKNNLFSVVVLENSVCYSSCVFILASGTIKAPIGKVGIHRPYFYSVREGKSIEEIRNMREALNVRIKSFLKFVDVPETLLDEMLAYPPEKIKILSEDELTRFRLNGKDATQDELDVANSANFFNLSSSEYRRRWDESFASCSHLIRSASGENVIRCIHSKILKISESEYERRMSRATKNCGNKTTKNLRCEKSYLVENRQ